MFVAHTFHLHACLKANFKRPDRIYIFLCFSQLAWLDALDAGTWFSIPPETLCTGLVLCYSHFDSSKLILSQKKTKISRSYKAISIMVCIIYSLYFRG